MKIAVCSDIHLEFGDIELKNNQDAKVLVIAGDAMVASHAQERFSEGVVSKQSVKAHRFFQQVCDEFPYVLYVMGNHEHYHDEFTNTYNALKHMFGYLPNLKILEKESFQLDDVTFFGGTMWTNFNNEDPITMQTCKFGMNDYMYIKNSVDNSYRLTPANTLADHKEFVTALRNELPNSDKVVVLTHHAPSHLSIHPKYAHDSHMNGAYYSDLSDLIMDNPQIKLWVHGHVHTFFDYNLGDTRVLCNPRGYYNQEQSAANYLIHYVEV